jgi:hypothetical protein
VVPEHREIDADLFEGDARHEAQTQ